MNEVKVLYSLNTEDAQTVAIGCIDRELSEKELIELEDLIAEQIDWYSAIEYAIHKLMSRQTE